MGESKSSRKTKDRVQPRIELATQGFENKNNEDPIGNLGTPGGMSEWLRQVIAVTTVMHLAALVVGSGPIARGMDSGYSHLLLLLGRFFFFSALTDGTKCPDCFLLCNSIAMVTFDRAEITEHFYSGYVKIEETEKRNGKNSH